MIPQLNCYLKYLKVGLIMSVFDTSSAIAANGFTLKVATRNISRDASPFYLSSADFPLAEAVFAPLIIMTNQFELKPNVITSWETESTNGKNSVLLELRPDVYFHNGRLATAEDLEFSLVRGMLKDADPKIRPTLSFIEGAEEIKGETTFRKGMCRGIQILDKLRIKVTLSTPNPSLIFHLTASPTSIVPREEFSDGLRKWKKFPVGTGPYAVQEVLPNKYILRRFDRYFSPKKDSPEQIELINTSDLSSVDITTPLVNPSNPQLDSWQKVNSAKGMIYSIRHFVLHTEDHKGKALRKLINAAVDKKSLATHLDSDFIEANQYLPPHYWPQIEPSKGENFEALKSEYESQHGKIPEIDVLLLRMFGEETPAKILARQVLLQLQNKGLPAKGVDVDNPYSARDDGKHYVLVAFGGFPFADPDALSFYFDNSTDILRAETQAIGKIRFLLKKGRTLTSRAERAAVYAEVLQTINDEGIAHPLFHSTERVFVRKKAINPSSVYSESYQFQYESFRKPN
jgi:oligopeptide transport system substrate-binding protein